MPNKLRGEVQVTLDGKQFTMVPSIEALIDIEERTGKTIGAIMATIMPKTDAPTLAEVTSMISARIVVACVYCGIRASFKDSRDAPSVENVGRMVQAEGLANMLAPVTRFLVGGMSSDVQLAETETRVGNASGGA